MNIDASSRPCFRAALCCLALLTALGCGRGGVDRPELHSVAGAVAVKGQPADGAKVILYPLDEALRGPGMPIPTGVAGPDGKFTLTSYEPGDGAPAGEYRVSVVWPEVVGPSEDPYQAVTRDRLKERYANPETSGLKATVSEGDNQLSPFELQ